MKIEPRYKKIRVIKGIEYYIIYKWYEVILLRIIKTIQKGLWYCGVAWHDFIFEECTPDFNCCCNVGRRAWIKFPQKPTSRYKSVE